MLLPRLHGELVDADVEQLDGAVAGGHEDLVLVRLGPGEVEEGVLGVEPGSQYQFSISSTKKDLSAQIIYC